MPQPSRGLRSPVIAASIALGSGAAGCERTGATREPPPAPAAVAANVGSAGGASGGQLFEGSAALPAEWPSDVPVYPGATVLSAEAVAHGFELSSETGAGAERVIAFYRERLGHLEHRGSMQMGTKQTLSWSKDEPPMSVTLSVVEEDRAEHTSVTLVIDRELP